MRTTTTTFEYDIAGRVTKQTVVERDGPDARVELDAVSVSDEFVAKVVDGIKRAEKRGGRRT